MAMERGWGVIIPGVAQVRAGRTVRGLFYFTGFTFCVNGALIAPLVTDISDARLILLGAAALLWLLSDIHRRHIPIRDSTSHAGGTTTVVRKNPGTSGETAILKKS